MSKIVTLEEYKGTFLEKCYTRDSNIEPEKILNQLNSNLEKGLISEELHEKAINQLNNLLEKGGSKKYIRRTGSPGNYKYEYTEHGKAHERAMTNTLNEKVGVKGGDFSENKVKKEGVLLVH